MILKWLKSLRGNFKVVVNSSVIIALAKIGKLTLLKELFKKIIIPMQVYEEVTKDPTLPGAEEIMKTRWIEVAKISNMKLFEELCSEIDVGEAAVIVLALEINADLVVLDDKLARKKAEFFGLRYTGTIGILILAKKRKLISSLRDVLIELRNKGFWISNKLFQKIVENINT